MPTVQRYTQGQVQESALPSNRVDARVAEGAFGVAEAKAIGGAIEQAGKIVKDYTDYADQIKIMEAEGRATALETRLLYDKDVGALNQKGKNSFGLPDTVKADYIKGIEDIRKDLNERQKQAFEKIVVNKGLGIDRTIQKHVSNEMLSYDTQETESYLQTKRDAAVAAYNDPQKVQGLIEDQQLALMAHAQRHGLPSEWVKTKAEGAASQTHATVLQMMMNNGDDLGAEAYYTANKDFFIGKDKIAAEKDLEISSLRGRGQRTSDAIIAKGLSMSEAMEEARKVEDPKLRDETVRRVSEIYVQKRQAERLDLEQSHIAATDLIEKHGTVDAIPPSVWNKFSLSERSSLIRYADAKTSGKNIKTNWETYYEFKTMASSPELRQSFMEKNLYKHRDQFADAEFKELVNMQTQLRGGKSPKELDGYRTDSMIVADALKEIKIKPGSKEGVLFHRKVDDEIMAFQDRTGKKASNKDVQQIVDLLRIRGVTEPGVFWGTKKYNFERIPGEKFDVKAADIPKEERGKIEEALRRSNLPVNDQAVLELYTRKMRVNRGS
jgi:hypothetical protein